MAHGIKLIAAERLELSRSPTSEIAAAALDAKAEAELDGPGADFIVIAVPRGTVTDVADRVRDTLELDVPTS
jgi:prephenate dehydrogenase